MSEGENKYCVDQGRGERCEKYCRMEKEDLGELEPQVTVEGC